MRNGVTSRRRFLKIAGTAGAGLFASGPSARLAAALGPRSWELLSTQSETGAPDYTLRIAASAIEIAPKHILSAVTYNGKFPGPLLRFKEGQPVSVDIHNETDTPEQLHWHGQLFPADVDGAAEEGTPFIPAHGKRRIEFIPKPAGFRFYHTHNRGGADLHAGQYSGQVGPVYIEPKHDPGNYDERYFSSSRNSNLFSVKAATWPWIFSPPPRE